MLQRQEQISELTSEQTDRQHELEAIDRDRTAASLELTRSEERLLGLQEAVERVREDLNSVTCSNRKLIAADSCG
jgi:chromosome segregation ATPase